MKEFFACNQQNCMQATPMKEVPMQATPMKPAMSCRPAPTSNCDECVYQAVGYAQAYVAMQTRTEMMSPSDSLVAGTVYEALNMPYMKGSNLRMWNKGE